MSGNDDGDCCCPIRDTPPTVPMREQEIERLKEDLAYADKSAKDAAEQYKQTLHHQRETLTTQCRNLEQSLATMTTERDAFRGIFCDNDFTATLEQAQVMWRTLKRQLAAMTRERDELNKVCMYHEKIESDILAQLAASQARCDRAMKQADGWERTYEETCKRAAQLQATLAAREETIHQLSVANQYFAISEEALANQRDAAVQEAARLRARLAVLEEEA